MAKNYRQDKAYQQSHAPAGLSITDGMMINNRPDGMTGIQQAAMLRKAARRADKISMMAEATYLGYTRAEMMGEMNGGCEGCD